MTTLLPAAFAQASTLILDEVRAATRAIDGTSVESAAALIVAGSGCSPSAPGEADWRSEWALCG